VRTADNLTTFMCRLSWYLGASNSWNPQGLSRLVMGLLYLVLRSKISIFYQIKLFSKCDWCFTAPGRRMCNMHWRIYLLCVLRIRRTGKPHEVAVSGFGTTSKLSPLKSLRSRSGFEKNESHMFRK